jgi:uncharacterized membrane protein SirB2
VSGTLRLFAALAVVLLAGLGLLLVLGVIPVEQFQTWSLKSVLVLVILALAAIAMGLLMKGGKAD